MTRIIKLALLSDMNLWNQNMRDGISFHKMGTHKEEGNGKVKKCTNGSWSDRINEKGRVSNFKAIFGEIPRVFKEKNIEILEELRSIRNNIGHSFGADLQESKKQYDDLIPLEVLEVEHEEIIKYLKLTYSIARSIDKKLMTNHIGTYQYLKFYHDNQEELKNKSIKIQANILKKAIAEKDKDGTSKIDLFNKDFYIELIKYYNNL